MRTSKLKEKLFTHDNLFVLGLLATVAIATLPFFNPQLILSGHEHIGFYYPLSYFHDTAIDSGEMPSWIGGYYGGVSAPFQQFISIFSPLSQILFLLFPFILAHHLGILIPIFAGVLITYVLSRQLGISPTGSFIVGCSYLLAFSFDVLNIGPIVSYTFLFYPLLLLCIWKIYTKQNPALFFIIGTIGIGLGFLAGFAQYIFYMLLVGGLFALYLDLFHEPKKITEKKLLHRMTILRSSTFTLGLMFIGGILLGFRQIVVSLFLLEDSIRSIPAPAESTFSVVKGLYTLFLPPYLDLPFLGGGATGLYVGGFSLLLVLISVVTKPNRIMVFLTVTILILFGFGLHVPPFSWINDNIPPLENFRFMFRYLTIVSLPLSLLAGLGFDRLISSSETRKLKLRTLIRMYCFGLLFLISCTVLGTLSLLYISNNVSTQQTIVSYYFIGREMLYPVEHYQSIIARMIDGFFTVFSFGNPWFIVPVLLFLMSPIIIWLYTTNRIARFELSLLAITITVVNLVFVYSYNAQNFVSSSYITKEPELVTTINRIHGETNESFRTMGYFVDESIVYGNLFRNKSNGEKAFLRNELMLLSGNLLHDIDSIDGFEVFRSIRQNQLIDTIVVPSDYFVFDEDAFYNRTEPLDTWNNTHVLMKVTAEEKFSSKHLRLPLISMMNVKYIYSLFPLHHPDLEAISIEASLDFPIYLYENVSVLPRVYFADEVLTYPEESQEEVLNMIISIDDFSETSIVECAVCPANTTEDKSGSIKLHEYRNGNIRLSSSRETDGWLIISESHSPGWAAFIDDTETDIYSANYIFQAIFVPAGEHEINLTHMDIGKKKLLELRSHFFNM